MCSAHDKFNTCCVCALLHWLPQDCVIWRVQVHGDYTEEAGAPVERPAEEIPGNEPVAEAEATPAT